MKQTTARRNWTPTATADSTNLVDGSYHAIQGANSTQVLLVVECYMGGLASATQSPMDMNIAFDSTVATGTLGGSTTITMYGANITALASGSGPIGFSNATVTKPQRNTTPLLTPAFNAFGGIVRWAAIEADERIRMVGNAAGAGELSLSANTGSTTGAMSDHIIVEVV